MQRTPKPKPKPPEPAERPPSPPPTWVKLLSVKSRAKLKRQRASESALHYELEAERAQRRDAVHELARLRAELVGMRREQCEQKCNLMK